MIRRMRPPGLFSVSMVQRTTVTKLLPLRAVPTTARGAKFHRKKETPACAGVEATTGAVRSELGRDQSQVVVPALVDHRDPVRVDVAEDDELVLRVVEPEGGLFDRHRADGDAVGLDDA